MTTERPKKPGKATAFDRPALAIPKPDELVQQLEEQAQAPEPSPDPEDGDYNPLTHQIFQGEAFTNLDKSKDKKIVDFNFKVTPQLRHQFKIVSANWNVTNKALLEACFKLFLNEFGRSPQEAKKLQRQRDAAKKKTAEEQG